MSITRTFVGVLEVVVSLLFRLCANRFMGLKRNQLINKKLRIDSFPLNCDAILYITSVISSPCACVPYSIRVKALGHDNVRLLRK